MSESNGATPYERKLLEVARLAQDLVALREKWEWSNATEDLRWEREQLYGLLSVALVELERLKR